MLLVWLYWGISIFGICIAISFPLKINLRLWISAENSAAAINMKLRFLPILPLRIEYREEGFKIFLPGGKESELAAKANVAKMQKAGKVAKRKISIHSVFRALSSISIEKVSIRGKLQTGSEMVVSGLLSATSIIFFNLICNIIPLENDMAECLILPDPGNTSLQLDFGATFPMGVVFSLLMQILTRKEKK